MANAGGSISSAAIERVTEWVDYERLTWSAASIIRGGHLASRAANGMADQVQEVFCNFSLLSSYKTDIGKGFLVRVSVEKLEFGMQNSLKEELARGYFVDEFTLSIVPVDESACEGIVGYTPESENIKSEVMKQRGNEFAASVSTTASSATMRWIRQEETTEEHQLWSWTRELCGKSSRTAQFTWRLEEWKKPRSPYNKKKPHHCGTPIPELPYDGDGIPLLSCASVEWHVPEEKVKPLLEVSWTFILTASVKFVEIKKNGPFSKRMTHEVLVSLPISKYLTVRLPRDS